MILVSIVFFGIAAWNVGNVNAPATNWQATTPESFYVNLGSTQQVQTVYFWVQSGNASVEVSSGTPGNWSYISQFSLQSLTTDYDKQPSLNVNTITQYLEFNVTPGNYDTRPDFYWSVPNPSDKQPSPFVEVSEIGLLSQNNMQTPIISITGENNTDASLVNLVDEQNSAPTTS